MQIMGFLGRSSGWRRQLWIALLLLAAGALLLPVLIFLCGITFLGPLDGGGLGRTFATVFSGLVDGSPSSWIVVAGPYGLFLLLRLLRLSWRLAGARA